MRRYTLFHFNRYEKRLKEILVYICTKEMTEAQQRNVLGELYMKGLLSGFYYGSPIYGKIASEGYYFLEDFWMSGFQEHMLEHALWVHNHQYCEEYKLPGVDYIFDGDNHVFKIYIYRNDDQSINYEKFVYIGDIISC